MTRDERCQALIDLLVDALYADERPTGHARSVLVDALVHAKALQHTTPGCTRWCAPAKNYHAAGCPLRRESAP